MKFCLKYFLLFISLFLWLTILNAQEMDSNLEDLFFQEIPVMIASKTQESVSKAPATVSVIPSEDLQRMGALTYLDALKMLPGVEISLTRYGQYEIIIRGIKSTGTEKVLVLIDGHPVNESFFGSAMTLYDDLSVENIQQIEVIRGPGSALYGANAVTGVINIITKKTKNIKGDTVIVQAGSWNTKKSGFLFGKQMEEWDYSGYIEYFETDGFKETVTSDLQSIFDGLTGSDASLAPGDTNFYKKKWDYNLNVNSGNFSVNTKFSERERGDYIGLVYALGNETKMDLEQGFIDVRYDQKIIEELHLKWDLYYDYFYEDIYFEVFPGGYTNSLGEVFPEGYIICPSVRNQKYGIDLQTEYVFTEKNSLLLGFFYEYLNQDNVEYSTNANPFTDAYLGGVMDVTDRWNWNKNAIRKIWAVYLQDRWRMDDNLDLTLGIRHDDYSDFGGTSNPRAALIWTLSDKIVMKVLYGTAFRAPNFRELYDRNNANTVGNPDLDPEKIDTMEAEIDFKGENYIIRTTLFHNKIEDIIVEGSRPSTTEPAPFVNLRGETTVKGVELESRWLFNKSNFLYAMYSYQTSEDQTGRELADIPEHKGNVGFNLGWGSFINFNVNLFISGERPRAEGDTREPIDEYSILNTTLGYSPSDVLRFSFSVYNVLDEEYVEPGTVLIPDDYPQPGTSYWGKISCMF